MRALTAVGAFDPDDQQAVAQLVADALEHELRACQIWIALSEGHPVKQELVLRYAQERNEGEVR